MTLLLLQSGPGANAGGVAITAPTNTVAPAISGTIIVGQTLTTTNGTWTGSPTGYSYQWLRGGVNISGATSNTYLLVTADLAATITVTVTATNAGGSASATSTGVGPIVAAGHRYWRINMTAGAAGAYAFSEIQFRTIAGSSLAFSGGTASAAQTFGGTPGANDASKAADGNISTLYSSINNTAPQWWAYDFGAGNVRAVAEIALTARNDASFNQAPSSFTPQWSDDGITWTSKQAVTTATWTSAGQVQLFAVAADTAAAPTWDPAILSGATLSGGNLVVTNTGTTAGDQGARGITAKTTGKNYFEITFTNFTGGGVDVGIGVGTTDSTYAAMGNNSTTGAAMFLTTGNIWTPGSASGLSIGARASGQTIGVAVDLTNRKIWFKQVSGTPGNWNGSGTADPATNVGGSTIPAGTMLPFCTFGGSGGSSGNIFTANFGTVAFVGAVPSSFTSGWT